MTKKEQINISLTEFINYVNKSGLPKLTVIKQAKIRREEEYEVPTDYWKAFRSKLVKLMKENSSLEPLYDILESIAVEKQHNYQRAIDGFISYFKKKKYTWVKPPRGNWKVKNLEILIQPEIGFQYKGVTYFVKLFLSANDILDKRHASLILKMMDISLRDKISSDDRLAVLDVNRGKLFDIMPDSPDLEALLISESTSLIDLWERI